MLRNKLKIVLIIVRDLQFSPTEKKAIASGRDTRIFDNVLANFLRRKPVHSFFFSSEKCHFDDDTGRRKSQNMLNFLSCLFMYCIVYTLMGNIVPINCSANEIFSRRKLHLTFLVRYILHKRNSIY